MPDAGTLANEINVTLQAQQAFEQAVAALNSIVSEVFSSQQQLTTNGMVTTAGQRFGGAVVQWAEDFEDMRSTLNWMAQQLGDTAQQLQKGNEQSADMAAALPQFGSSGFVSAPA
jgi:metal-dependent amidase/aminoacylase/carboxypeptidase family protein